MPAGCRVCANVVEGLAAGAHEVEDQGKGIDVNFPELNSKP